MLVPRHFLDSRAHPVQLLIQRALWAAVQATKQAPMHGGGSPGAGLLWRGLVQEEAGGKAVIGALNDDGDRAEMIVGSRAQARSRGASPHRARGCWCPACRVGTHLARQQLSEQRTATAEKNPRSNTWSRRRGGGDWDAEPALSRDGIVFGRCCTGPRERAIARRPAGRRVLAPLYCAGVQPTTRRSAGLATPARRAAQVARGGEMKVVNETRKVALKHGDCHPPDLGHVAHPRHVQQRLFAHVGMGSDVDD